VRERRYSPNYFHDINDRRMPLSDSDIFKAQIYRTKKSNDEKKDFTDHWKELTEITEDAKICIDDLFRYYTHIIRAKNDDKSKEIGLRKFYAADNSARLKETELITNLTTLSDFWFAVNTGAAKINDVEKINIEAQKYLHCLQCYPNEYWKFVTSVFFYKNGESDNFIDTFPAFLKRLTAFLFVKFIEKPTVNAIKDDIYQYGIDVFSNKPLNFGISINDQFKKKLSDASSLKIGKAVILLHAYQNPKQLTIIPSNFEVEHIFPRIWQNTNYNGWEKKDADEYLEKFGNKVAIEKKVNIQAGNGYFGKKKGKYSNSKIGDVLDLSTYSINDWVKNDIETKEVNFINVLLRFFTDNLVS